ncbi:putative 4-hydroxy-4-methyl-2-oxoglutarate aldolase 2, partial [Cucurbita argyrosperma subsp. sororia]
MALVTTAEVCDANPQLIVNGELRALEPVFQIYGRRQVFSGPVVTLKVFEDNVLIREFLEEKGNGRVLVVDGGGSKRCAILGGNPVVQAQNNGWAGIVVNGCVRDVDEINGCDIGVRALASHPMKAYKKRVGEKHVPITIAGTRIMDGEWLYADTDGILTGFCRHQLVTDKRSFWVAAMQVQEQWLADSQYFIHCSSDYSVIHFQLTVTLDYVKY